MSTDTCEAASLSEIASERYSSKLVHVDNQIEHLICCVYHRRWPSLCSLASITEGPAKLCRSFIQQPCDASRPL